MGYTTYVKNVRVLRRQVKIACAIGNETAIQSGDSIVQDSNGSDHGFDENESDFGYDDNGTDHNYDNESDYVYDNSQTEDESVDLSKLFDPLE